MEKEKQEVTNERILRWLNLMDKTRTNEMILIGILVSAGIIAILSVLAKEMNIIVNILLSIITLALIVVFFMLKSLEKRKKELYKKYREDYPQKIN